MNPRTSKVPPAGFTLIELITVIAIVAILAVLIVPAIAKMSQRANNAKCASNLKQLATVAQSYAADNGEFWTVMEEQDLNGSTWYEDIQTVLNPGELNELLQCPGYKQAFSPNWNPSGNSYTMNSDLDGDGTDALQPGRGPADRPAAISHPSFIPFFFDGMPPSSSNAAQAAEYGFYSDPADVGEYHPNETHNVVFVDGHVENTDQAALADWETKRAELFAN
ncbi:MAG: type II secretion system protein [Chthoniobacterales bacterium]